MPQNSNNQPTITQVAETSTNCQVRVGLKPFYSMEVLQDIDVNPSSSTRRVSGELDISQSSVIRHRLKHQGLSNCTLRR